MATPEVQEFQGEWTSGKRQLTGEALKTACEHWMMYLETYDEIAAAFAKYDEDHTDTLSKDQLANVLQHLNQGEPVDEEEVDAVLAQIGHGPSQFIARLAQTEHERRLGQNR